jgi:hypothetical protein
MSHFFRHAWLPRIVFLTFYLTKIWLLVLRMLRKFQLRRSISPTRTLICIEAGIKGWESIEFKELYQSACEYLGSDNIIKAVIRNDESYLDQVESLLSKNPITHYVYDPRTGSQNWLLGLWQALKIASCLHWHGVVPIVLLSDLSVRTWRSQSAMVTADRGVVITFMSPREVQPIFPHQRLVGPCLMPLSEKTFRSFAMLKEEKAVEQKAVFVGSLYEPRRTILNQIKAGLEQRDLVLEIKGRELGTARIPDQEYWGRLINAPIVITTASQLEQNGSDWTWIPHLLYRYIEAIASGSLLVAPEVSGIRRFFEPGKHFVSFDSVDKAVDVITYYLAHPDEREAIARQGQKQAEYLISSKAFWMGVDIALGSMSLY